MARLRHIVQRRSDVRRLRGEGTALCDFTLCCYPIEDWIIWGLACGVQGRWGVCPVEWQAKRESRRCVIGTRVDMVSPGVQGGYRRHVVVAVGRGWRRTCSFAAASCRSLVVQPGLDPGALDWTSDELVIGKSVCILLIVVVVVCSGNTGGYVIVRVGVDHCGIVSEV